MSQFKQGLLSLMALSSLVMISACGSSTMTQAYLMDGTQQQMGTSATGAYSYPAPQTLSQGTAQPVQGGKAVATANGYVYEQSPLSNATGYDFYNSQNPCLYPKPGQTVQCNGTASYYNTQPQQRVASNPTVPYGNSSYPATNSSYPASSSYGTGTTYPGPAGSYATGTTNPYATGSSYATGTTYPSTSSYAQQAAPRSIPQTVPQNTAVQSQTAQTSPPHNTAPQNAAQSRLAPEGSNAGQTSNNQSSKPKVTF